MSQKHNYNVEDLKIRHIEIMLIFFGKDEQETLTT